MAEGVSAKLGARLFSRLLCLAGTIFVLPLSFSPLSSPSSLTPLDYVRVADGSVLEEECECNRVYGMSMSSMLYAVCVYVCMCYIIA